MRSSLLALAATAGLVPAAGAQPVGFDDGVQTHRIVEELAPQGIRRRVGWTTARKTVKFGPGRAASHLFVLRSMEIIEQCAPPNPSSPGGCTFVYENPVTTAFRFVDARADRSAAGRVVVTLSGSLAGAWVQEGSAAVRLAAVAPGQHEIRLVEEVPAPRPRVEPGRPQEDTQAP
ncbi:MAG: hypothetical protein HY553_15760 [Elusimicrobia bacterium]|nr:hypothetical protein [Elusimicrobiota bacterium]